MSRARHGAPLFGIALLSACASFNPDIGPLRAAAIDGSVEPEASAARTDAAFGDGALDGGGGDSTGGPEAGAPEAAPQVWTVTVGANGAHVFAPASLDIQVGDTVHWVWQVSGHTVTSGTAGTADGRFCSPADGACTSAQTSMAGATYDHTFSSAGGYPYFCAIHQSMVGSITVH